MYFALVQNNALILYVMKKKIISWLAHEDRLLKYPFFRRFFWKRGVVYRRMEELASNMRKKEIITVAFMALDLPCWKCDSVFRLMLSHPRFRPVIWIVPELQIKDEVERQRKLTDMRRYFSDCGYPVADLYTLEQIRAEYAPDIVFLAKPYWGATSYDVYDLDQELVCNVPYCYHNTERGGFQHMQEEFVWRNYFSSYGVLRQARKYMRNGGANVRIVGHPVADAFLYSGVGVTISSPWKHYHCKQLQVIWAPHWSINGQSWFSTATFLELADGMLELAVKYADCIQWAFKPHPLLREALYQHPDWGKERTDAYYERWSAMPHTQLDSGDYVELFKQSDAMIHDSGSFIIEYLLVDKPCMYLQNENLNQVEFNEDTREALACYSKGRTMEDVEQFLKNLLSDSEDTFKAARAHYKQRYLQPPRGVSAAQNIINDILNGR